MELKPVNNNNNNKKKKKKKKKKKNSLTLIRERTIPAERPPLVHEVNANFCG
jgi:hypothetical protein